jgi:hypothetical protein
MAQVVRINADRKSWAEPLCLWVRQGGREAGRHGAAGRKSSSRVQPQVARACDKTTVCVYADMRV